MLIAITLPTFIPHEAEAIIRLFDERGIDRLHIRKPGADEDDVAALIERIPTRLYLRISIHDHHALAVRYCLGGIHLNVRHPVAPEGWQGLVSTSCHSLAELAERRRELSTDGTDSHGEGVAAEDIAFHGEGNVVEEQTHQPGLAYLSLSPIFDSISKQGYHAAFTHEQLAEARRAGIIDHRVLALGGVTFARLPEVEAMGFGGAMILGDAWR